MTRPTFDERDAEILREKQAERDAVAGPRVGDFVRFPGEDEPRRFSYDWGEDIQTAMPRMGSIYLFGACASFSGSLQPAIPKAGLRDTGEAMEGRFWFFHHGFAGAGCGVDFTIPCRVYEYAPAEAVQA